MYRVTLFPNRKSQRIEIEANNPEEAIEIAESAVGPGFTARLEDVEEIKDVGR